ADAGAHIRSSEMCPCCSRRRPRPVEAESVGRALADGSAGGKAIRGSALRVGSFVAQLGLSLAAVPLMVRHLGPDDYGRYVTVSSIVFIIAGFTEAGL